MMTSRQRLIETLNHRQPDQVCVDFGATAVTGMHVSALTRLRRAVLGEPGHRAKVIEPYQMLGEFDEPLREALGIDVFPCPVRGGEERPAMIVAAPASGWLNCCTAGKRCVRTSATSGGVARSWAKRCGAWWRRGVGRRSGAGRAAVFPETRCTGRRRAYDLASSFKERPWRRSN